MEEKKLVVETCSTVGPRIVQPQPPLTPNPNRHPTPPSTLDSTIIYANVRSPFDGVIVLFRPVGLWCAINLKLLKPEARVLVVDKYNVYHRHHILQLDPPASMAG